MQTAYFLGANSKKGFYSRYDSLIDENHAKKIFILKGTPGCGKSTFMKKIAAAAQNAGYDTEMIMCSADPESADGVIIPELGVALADGTSPHIIEPKYPLALEEYIDLSVYADKKAIAKKRDTITALFKKYKSFYTRAYRLCGCCGQLANEVYDIALSAADTEKLRKKADGIISREIKRAGNSGTDVPRFLSSISHMGYTTLFPTVSSLAERVYTLEDSCGLSGFILHPIKEAAMESGYKVISCYSPLLPDRLEHILIPELSLAFVTSSRKHSYPNPGYRNIRVDATLDKEKIKPKKQKFIFTQKLMDALMSETYSTLKEAKEAHDALEMEYNPHIDFDGISAHADKICIEIGIW